MRMLAFIAAVLGVVLVLMLGACAGGGARADAANMPDDFSLSVTVLPGSGEDPSWYIVEPDGTLRAALGTRQASSPLPAEVRSLTRAQVRDVWELACAAGLAGERQTGGRVAGSTPGSPVGVAVVEVASAGRRRTMSAPAAGDAGGEGLARLVHTLRDLAWVYADAGAGEAGR